MPGYVIHLTEAEMVIKLLQKKEITDSFNENWLQQFRLGNLMPDAFDDIHKGESHFRRRDDVDSIITHPDVHRFLKEYQISISNPALMGYFVHLYLDDVFFLYFERECVTFYDRCGNITSNNKQVANALIHSTGEIVKVNLLFSEEYMYGDYTKMNHYFQTKYDIKVPAFFEKVKVPVKEAINMDMSKLLHKLRRFLSEENDGEEELRVFTKESVESFLWKTAKDLETYFVQ